jgi:hypothetical protein
MGDRPASTPREPAAARPAPATSHQRRHAALLAGGAAILLHRTIALVRGARRVLKPWVVALTYLEMAVDLLTIGGAVRWWRSGSADDARFPLRVGMAATLLHAVRVLVFVLGRVGPWVDLDVRPEARAGHGERWTWGEVVFAGTMSVLGVVGVGVIWRRRRLGDRTAETPLAQAGDTST